MIFENQNMVSASFKHVLHSCRIFGVIYEYRYLEVTLFVKPPVVHCIYVYFAIMICKVFQAGFFLKRLFSICTHDHERQLLIIIESFGVQPDLIPGCISLFKHQIVAGRKQDISFRHIVIDHKASHSDKQGLFRSVYQHGGFAV